MKYIEYDKETLGVVNIFDKEPVYVSKHSAVARAETIPQGDILTVTNIQPETEKYTVKERKLITVKSEETDEEYEKYVTEEAEKEREFFTCDIIGTVDERKVIYNKINKLKDWFNNNYRMYNEMLTRRATLGIEKGCVDKIRNKTYYSLNDLYAEAEIVVAEINELEEKLKG